MKVLEQYKWFRKMFDSRTYYKSSGVWKNLKSFRPGEKIDDIDGYYHNLLQCDCGNELIHSRSFVKEEKINMEAILRFDCTFCGETKYYNSDIMPGLLRCNKEGIPIITRSSI